jgi:hypothetical protein
LSGDAKACSRHTAVTAPSRDASPQTRVGNKKPTQKKPTLKNSLKMFFIYFLNFKFFMKIIQTFLFETDFL